MITKDRYEKIKSRLKDFKYNSLNYVRFESIKSYDVLCENESMILIYGYSIEDQLHQYHWACNEVGDLIGAMPRKEGDVLITFVPKDWIKALKEAGFQMYAVWNEYLADPIQASEEKVALEKIQPDEYERVSRVTLACRGQSRGFSGQTTAWVEQWVEGKEPALPSYATNSAILVKKIAGDIVGAICVATYAHESEKGAILWIREVAVHPDHQRKGIGRALIQQAYHYGLAVGAKRAFLMADECNEHAIHLYESMGFKGSADDAEFNMIRW